MYCRSDGGRVEIVGMEIHCLVGSSCHSGWWWWLGEGVRRRGRHVPVVVVLVW